MDTVKRCPKCAEDKPLTEFWKNRTTRDGFQPWCKPCWYVTTKKQLSGPDRERALRWRKNTHLVRKYGITLEQYEAMLAEQGGACRICRTTDTGHKAYFAVDHDHKTGAVRGLLCVNCNAALGHVNDNTETLTRMITYLQEHAHG